MRADAGCSGAGGHAWVRKPFTLWFWRCLKNTIPLGSHACNCNHLLCCPAFLCPPLLRCLLCRNTFYARVASSSNLILASKAAACALSSSAALLSSALLASSACFAATANALLDASATSVALQPSLFRLLLLSCLLARRRLRTLCSLCRCLCCFPSKTQQRDGIAPKNSDLPPAVSRGKP